MGQFGIGQAVQREEDPRLLRGFGEYVADVTRQYEWYKAQGMLKGAADSAAMIDRRYVVDMATKR